MLGFGTVGQGAYRMLSDNRAAIERKVGAPIEVARIGVRDPDKPRPVDPDLVTTDLESIVRDPSTDVILELMGGVEPAGSLIETALAGGKHVVTANKELIAKQGSRLLRLAADQGLDLHFEAAVGGGIPLIQPLKHQLAGNDVLKLMGILNGTTNYILTKMAEEGAEFQAALEQAQAAGFAEADPSSDVEGYDAQYKLAILSSIAFNREVSPDQVHREGIGTITKRDMQFADLLGFRIKLLGIAESFGDRILARVHPTLVPKEHPLAEVRGVYNAVWIQGDFVGDVMFSGKGAGGAPTASAVIGDLIDVCRNIRIGGAGNLGSFETGAEAVPIDELRTRFYLRLIVKDRPKTLGCIATIFGNCDISLSAMEMRVIDTPRNLGEIVFLTHPCLERAFHRAVKAIANLHMVESVANWLRVEQ
jgi:homoserine dehydrogenase